MDHLALQRTVGLLPLTPKSSPSKKPKGPEKDPEDRLSLLRRQKSEQFLAIALEELAGRISYVETSERLSSLAEYILNETLLLAEDRLNREVIHPVYPKIPAQFLQLPSVSSD